MNVLSDLRYEGCWYCHCLGHSSGTCGLQLTARVCVFMPAAMSPLAGR
jgi:hypothetical protein